MDERIFRGAGVRRRHAALKQAVKHVSRCSTDERMRLVKCAGVEFDS